MSQVIPVGSVKDVLDSVYGHLKESLDE